MEINWLFPTKLYLKMIFWLKMGYRLNLKKPKTFCEKLQWLKINNRKPEFTKLVDKDAVKSYVEKMIGPEYIIPTLGIWDNPEEIDWDLLPNQFVLKTTYGGGSSGVVICKDKETIDRNKAIAKLKHSMKQNIWRKQREWPYKNVPKKIIAEKYIAPVSNTDDLPDYKFFCFNGDPYFCQVISGRNKKMSVDFFDVNWNHQNFVGPKKYTFAEIAPNKPRNFEKMLGLAKILANGHPFVRIDFYDNDEGVYFGEITFFPTSGMGGFNPDSYDLLLGKLIKLPIDN
jgi:hypothetical protein